MATRFPPKNTYSLVMVPLVFDSSRISVPAPPVLSEAEVYQ